MNRRKTAVPARSRGWGAIVLLVGAVLVAGCTAGPAGTRSVATPSSQPAPPTSSPATPSAWDRPSAEPTPSVALATPDGEGPPAAALAVEGGDPVVGQLGTFTWRETGSDAPWLPGAPIAIGAGEPLMVALDPPTGVATWRARYVPTDADGPEGATSLGEGTGTPAFEAPGSGTWTLEVRITFVDGLGDAGYFWRLDVT